MMRLKSLFRVCSPQLYVNINSLFIEASTDGHIARPFVLSEQSFLQDIETNGLSPHGNGCLIFWRDSFLH